MPQSQPANAPPDERDSGEVSADELRKHRGHWIAFSPDGRRIVASSLTLANLDALVRAAGENPEEVLLERIPDGESIASGLDLS